MYLQIALDLADVVLQEKVIFQSEAAVLVVELGQKVVKTNCCQRVTGGDRLPKMINGGKHHILFTLFTQGTHSTFSLVVIGNVGCLNCLEVHISVHMAGNPTTGPRVRNHFQQAGLLSSHRHYHKEEKLQLCSVCGKAFKDFCTFSIHNWIYSGASMYV